MKANKTIYNDVLCCNVSGCNSPANYTAYLESLKPKNDAASLSGLFPAALAVAFLAANLL